MTSEKSTNGSSVSKRGGYREGAGRPVGRGRIQGEKTQMMRVPVRCKEMVKRVIETTDYTVSVFNSGMRAGLPTNVAEEAPEQVSLVTYLTEHPEDTFLVRAEGDSMIDANIVDGDLLIVDGGVEALDGNIVVASVNNDCTVKRLRRHKHKTELHPANPDYPVIPITEETAFHIWGVVKKKVGDVG